MLDAALAVFAEKGYEGATLDEVAERAEFGKGTLYNDFPHGKSEILFALLDGVYDGLVAIIETYFTEETERHRPARPLFRDFIAALIAYFSEHQAVFMILAKDAPRLMLDADTAERFFAQRERVAEAVSGPIRAAMARGDLRPLDAHGVAHMLMGNIHGYMMHAFVSCRAGHTPTVTPRPVRGGRPPDLDPLRRAPLRPRPCVTRRASVPPCPDFSRFCCSRSQRRCPPRCAPRVPPANPWR